MIIIGYQGIGKSTLAGKNNYIDLESGNFWHNGVRPDNWYVFYCQIAEHLSQQGYDVFVSSHEVVRNRLKKYSKEPLYIVCPSIILKEEWIDKLKKRFESSKLEKDYKAWMNAGDRYVENIMELERSGINYVEITDMNYSLEDILLEIEKYENSVCPNCGNHMDFYIEGNFGGSLGVFNCKCGYKNKSLDNMKYANSNDWLDYDERYRDIMF